VPLDWATTQNNLGNALWRLGERSDSRARLEQAVSAYRAALEVWTREAVPLGWAMAHDNLGNALASLGERSGDPDRLEEAVHAYRAALEVRTRKTVPLDWAATQNNLGAALTSLGERLDSPERLEEAVSAFREALDVFRQAGRAAREWRGGMMARHWRMSFATRPGSSDGRREREHGIPGSSQVGPGMTSEGGPGDPMDGGARLNYPVILSEDDNGTILVTAPDFPEATTFGEDRDEGAFARGGRDRDCDSGSDR
jgi:tetratricopeptide (TPR) repeat protein